MEYNGLLTMSGMGVDIATGEVKSSEKKEHTARNMARLKEKSQALIADLAGGNGAIVEEIIDFYIARAAKLIGTDLECMIYDRMLERIKHKVNVGEKIVETKTKEIRAHLGA